MLDKLQMIEKMIDDQNFLGAYLILKKIEIDEIKKYEIVGQLIEKIISQLETLKIKGNKDRIIVLRSLLLWIFRDYEALGRIYKEQLKRYTQSSDSIVKILKNIGELGQSNIEDMDLKDELDEVMDNVKDGLDEFSYKVKSGEVQEQMEDFLNKAEEGVKEGLKQFSSFLDKISKEEKDDGKNNDSSNKD
jgi:hypothetical protein